MAGYYRSPSLTVLALDLAAQSSKGLLKMMGSALNKSWKAVKPLSFDEKWLRKNATSMTVKNGRTTWHYDPRAAEKRRLRENAEANKPKTHEEARAAHDEKVRQSVAAFEAKMAHNQAAANAKALDRLSPENKRALQSLTQFEVMKASANAARDGDSFSAGYYKDLAQDIAAGRMSNREIADHLEMAREANNGYKQAQLYEAKQSRAEAPTVADKRTEAPSVSDKRTEAPSVADKRMEVPTVSDKRSDAAWSIGSRVSEQSQSETKGASR